MFHINDLLNDLGLPGLLEPEPFVPRSKPGEQRVRRLLEDPHVRAGWSVKRIALAAGVSWGLADRICKAVRGPLTRVQAIRNGHTYGIKTSNLGKPILPKREDGRGTV